MRRAPYAYVALTLVSALLSGAALLGAIAYYHAGQASQARQDAQQAASQRAQSAAFQRKLCATLDPLAGVATLKPPAGNPRDNPSRAFEQKLVAVLAPLAELGPDVGCGARR